MFQAVQPRPATRSRDATLETEKCALPLRTHANATYLYVPLLALIAGLLAYRLTLIDRGHFAWGDERCFLPAIDLLDDLAAGDVRTAAARLFESRSVVPPGRPGFVLVSVPVAIVQRIVGRALCIAPTELGYFDAVSAVNIVVTIAITVAIFNICYLWTTSRLSALLATTLYSLLGAANFWIRHSVPYYWSSLWLLTALWIVSTTNASRVRRAAVAGGLTALGYCCYPGHYGFVLVNAAAAAWRYRRRPVLMLVFAFCAGGLVLAFEAAAFVGGYSYLGDLQRLSRSATMGDSNEAIVFLWRYLVDVEPYIGPTILIVAACGLLSALLRRVRLFDHPVGYVALAAAIGAYLLHAGLCLWGQRTVYYGRVVLVYLPLLCIACAATTMRVPGRARPVAVVAILALCLATFTQFAVRYARVIYPADFLNESLLSLGLPPQPAGVLWDLRDHQLVEPPQDEAIIHVADARPEGASGFVRLHSHAGVEGTNAALIGVNLKYFGYVGQRPTRFEPPVEFRLVAEQPSPESLAAWTYEGRKPWERTRLQSRDLTMRLYQIR